MEPRGVGGAVNELIQPSRYQRANVKVKVNELNSTFEISKSKSEGVEFNP